MLKRIDLQLGFRTDPEFLTGLSRLIDGDIYILDDVIKEKPLILMAFKPQTLPQIIEGNLRLQQET